MIVAVVEIGDDFFSGKRVNIFRSCAEVPALQIKIVGKFFTDEEATGTVAAPVVFLVEFAAVVAALIINGSTDETCVNPIFDLLIHF